ncbi:outer membrane protein assembly factor BamC [Spongiibacter taiwanensis]|uniref:outer membrane protein assembly factor BamC n=1 Tax=Spongiibacter taiwanensis TaxID=1748242 RepID=UPI002034DBE1|nr:outer membrane protein assembly factor BamC [Spongiibacter taiwanensis]USA44057.1 outer membrane protein assembly factor BamC [Spongiibacter taiwanensis]
MSHSMRRVGLPLLVVGLSVVVSACAFRDRGQDYRRAELSKPLELPAGVSSETLGDKYSVPGIERYQKLPGEFEVPPPEPIARNVGRSEVRIQRLDNEAWILMDGVPGQIWPQIRAFMNAASMEVARADVEQGLLESTWMQPSKGGAAERFRFRVEEGVQAGTAEVHITQAVNDGSDRWPARSVNPDREMELVKLLAQFLADTQGKHSAVSVLAKRGGTKGKIFLEGEGDYSFLRVQLPYDRAWGALGLALEKAGFEIEEASQNVNKFWVSYIPPQTEDPGWFKSFLFGDPRPPVARYVIEMKPVADEENLVYLNYQKGRRLRDAERQQVLERIKGYLY